MSGLSLVGTVSGRRRRSVQRRNGDVSEVHIYRVLCGNNLLDYEVWDEKPEDVRAVGSTISELVNVRAYARSSGEIVVTFVTNIDEGAF